MSHDQRKPVQRIRYISLQTNQKRATRTIPKSKKRRKGVKICVVFVFE